MAIHPLAGKIATQEQLINIPQLITDYFTLQPDLSIREQRVTFGTSGHRGSSFNRSFNEQHILATTQAICNYREKEGITGPIFIGIDTHVLSTPAQATALEVLAANSVFYFTASEGKSGGMMIVDMKDTSEIPRYAEPLFLHFKTTVDFILCMLPEVVVKADLESIGKEWG